MRGWIRLYDGFSGLEIELLHKKVDQLRETEVQYLTEAVKELTALLQTAKVELGALSTK